MLIYLEKMPDLSLTDLEKRADYVAHRLSLVANPKRLLILCELVKGEMSVSALQARVGLGQSALSQHLARLRDGEMVSTRREAQTIYYSISDPELRVLMAALYQAFCQEP